MIMLCKVFLNESGTRLVLLDASGGGYLYNPTNDKLLPVPRFSSSTFLIWAWRPPEHLPIMGHWVLLSTSLVRQVPRFSANATTVMWDSADNAVFVVGDPRQFSVYVHSPHSMDGPTVSLVQAPRILGRGQHIRKGPPY